MIEFETFEEAEDLNSDCVFCHKPKFVIFDIFKEDSCHTYGIDRCVKDDCDIHCRWDHKDRQILLDLGDEDHVGMVSSPWGAR